MAKKYNLVILHYSTNTVEYTNVPEAYKDDPAEYIYEVMFLHSDHIAWAYHEEGIETVYNE